MTSPGLKRPLDFEQPPHPSGPSGMSPNGSIANGNKRRCTNFIPQARVDNLGGHCNSLFKDSATILTPLNEDIASMIRDEIHKVHGKEPLVLTIRQTQIICEKLIRDREQKLREEYDRILACTIANYLNSYVDSRLTPTTPNQSINALAAAYTSGHPSALTASHLAFNLQQQAAVAAIQAHQRGTSTTSNSIPSGPVLLASNLDEQLATPEALFTLFGVFGDVIRVKILFNKKDNALIQMADANQAQVAQGNLDKQKVFGKIVRVTRSKHLLVQMPREGNQSDAGLTKDFTNSPLHRFKIPGSRNYQNIYPPSNTLHISNIPATIDECNIHKAFKDACGFEFASFKFFPKDKKMALMKFNSVEHATIALIKMHNYAISEDNSLRVSFSKSVMQQ